MIYGNRPIYPKVPHLLFSGSEVKIKQTNLFLLFNGTFVHLKPRNYFLCKNKVNGKEGNQFIIVGAE